MAEEAASAGIGYLLTTEKDAMNLPADAATRMSGVAIYWLKLGLQIGHGDELADLVCQRAQSSASTEIH